MIVSFLAALPGRVARSGSFRVRRRYKQLRKWVQRRLRSSAIMREYGSHLPILEAIAAQSGGRMALEFGMGVNSTGFLVDRFEVVFSVEHDPRWYRRTLLALESRDGTGVLIPVLWRDEHVEKLLQYLATERFDLALIDGPGHTRVSCARALLDRAEFLVLHDTEAVCYGWERLLDSEAIRPYPFYTFRRQVPWTTVVCSDERKLDVLIERFGGDGADKSVYYPPIR